MTSGSKRFVQQTGIFAGRFAAFAGGRGLLVGGLMIGGGLLEGAGLTLLVPLAAVLTGQQGGWLQALTDRTFGMVGVETQLGQVALLLAGFALVIVLRAIVLTLRDRRLAELQTDFVEHQRLRVVRAVAAASWQDVAILRHARVAHALSSDIARITGAAQALLQAMVAGVMLAIQLAITILIAPLLGALVLALMLVGGLALIPVFRGASAFGRTLTTGNLGMMDTAIQLLGGLKLAMAHNMQAAFVEEYEATAVDLKQHHLAFQRQQSGVRVVATTAAALIGSLLLLGGIWLAVPVPALLTSFVIFSRMVGPALTLQQSAQMLASMLPAQASLDTLFADLDERPTPPAAVADSSDPAGTIVFGDVTFAYAPRDDSGDGVEDGGGVRDVSLTIAPGDIVGVVGASGSGKTTFVDLLAGLITPQSGSITARGVPLDSRDARGWRAHLAYVAQDAYLFNDSLRRNLSWGNGAPDDVALWAALDLVGAGDLVRAMDVGLDTIVAERGARLSGGERQRIALARAVLRNPSLMILDEATNAIDVTAERAILDRIITDRPGRTLVIVAHRPESLARCRRILTFDRGRLIDDRAALPPRAPDISLVR